ncbi:uncharacterized protein LOC123905142 [Trifolium pratense]|uniref:uncharacterized protein LOC123905142 n=1 Tax=Trifolium pratense TaxID=57577 RepID=UPI001E6942FF|nr:uncharacterized protein LOC123905142 [Trifolium pratense]
MTELADGQNEAQPPFQQVLSKSQKKANKKENKTSFCICSLHHWVKGLSIQSFSMKCIYCKLRGLANSPTKLALKRLIVKHRPSFIFIGEPWMNIDSFPASCLRRLNLEIFKVNFRGRLLPNLWCLCSISLHPTSIDFDDQQISFMLEENSMQFFVAAIYASTSYVHRRKLWIKHSNLQIIHKGPWCFIGDFNTILGAHEHRGNTTPASTPMNDFFDWSNSNNLVHLPTKGVNLTWSNGRRGDRHIENRLDRSICNLDFIDAYIWNKEVFGNVHDQLKKAKDKVNEIQHDISTNGHSDLLMNQEKQAQVDLELALNIEEAFWKEKAKIKWSLEGDRNTKFFHRVAKINAATNKIIFMRNGDNFLTDPDAIADHVDDGIIDEVILNLVNSETNNMLTDFPSMEEVHHAVFALNTNCAAGPDGFGALFFQSYWDIVKHDVYKAVLQFFQSG